MMEVNSNNSIEWSYHNTFLVGYLHLKDFIVLALPVHPSIWLPICPHVNNHRLLLPMRIHCTILWFLASHGHQSVFNCNLIYLHSFSEIRAWVSNYILCIYVDVITFPCPGFSADLDPGGWFLAFAINKLSMTAWWIKSNMLLGVAMYNGSTTISTDCNVSANLGTH